MTQPLENLGRDVASALGDPQDDTRRLRQRRSLIEAVQERPRRSRHIWILAWSSAAAGVVMAAAIFVLLPTPAPIDFWVGAETTASREGVALRATAETPLVVRFADGSELSLAADSQAKIKRASGHVVHTELVHGRVDAKVRSGSGVAWDFIAGGFRIAVTGTELSVAWRGEDSRLEVLVTEGDVRVYGDGLGKGREVHAGERLRVESGEARFEAAPERLRAPPPMRPAVEALTLPTAPASSRTTDFSSDTSSDSSAGLSWRTLAQQGDYREALAAAKKQGIGRMQKQLDAPGLLLLADTARFSKDATTAHAVLAALGRRFAHTPEGARVPFLRGRIAAELDGDAAAGARWFRAYLTETPKGEFAEEARGRLLELLAQAGDAEAAHAEAVLYLGLYPTGSYAALARSLLPR